MPHAETRIPTDRANRYLAQLCRHTTEMRQHTGHRPRTHGTGERPPEIQHVEATDTTGLIETNLGRCTLHADPTALTLRVEADDEETLRRMQELIGHRVETIGRRDGLHVDWDGNPYTAPKSTRHPQRSTIILVAIAAAAISIHLVAGTILVSQWAGWAADAVIALIALKLIAAIALRRHLRRHR